MQFLINNFSTDDTHKYRKNVNKNNITIRVNDKEDRQKAA